MIEHDNFEDWLKAQRAELQLLIDNRKNLDPLVYIGLLSQELAVQDVINAWEFYQRHQARSVLPKSEQ